MTRDDLAPFADVIAGATADELPAIVGELERLKALAYARLMAPGPTAQADADELLSMDAVAEALGIGEWNARELGRQGAIPTVHVGERGVRVRRAALREYIRKNERGCTMSRAKRG